VLSRLALACSSASRAWEVKDVQGTLAPKIDRDRQNPVEPGLRDAQLAAAKSDIEAIGQSRLQMSFALTAPISYPLLLTVVGWVFFLFCGFGLMSRGGAMSVATLAVGAIAVASAVLLILDLSNPYSGVFRASSAPLEQVLAVMGKE
jgi:hypothetical protein